MQRTRRFGLHIHEGLVKLFAGRIDLTEFPVLFLIAGGELQLRFNRFCDVHQFVTGGLHIRIETGTDHGEDRRAIARPLFGLRDFERDPQHIRKDPAPER